eukprot:9576545-Alexandrium_andersonii.AAC.1
MDCHNIRQDHDGGVRKEQPLGHVRERKAFERQVEHVLPPRPALVQEECLLDFVEVLIPDDIGECNPTR